MCCSDTPGANAGCCTDSLLGNRAYTFQGRSGVMELRTTAEEREGWVVDAATGRLPSYRRIEALCADIATLLARVEKLEGALRKQHQALAANKTLPHSLCWVCDMLPPAAHQGRSGDVSEIIPASPEDVELWRSEARDRFEYSAPTWHVRAERLCAAIAALQAHADALERTLHLCVALAPQRAQGRSGVMEIRTTAEERARFAEQGAAWVSERELEGLLADIATLLVRMKALERAARWVVKNFEEFCYADTWGGREFEALSESTEALAAVLGTEEESVAPDAAHERS